MAFKSVPVVAAKVAGSESNMPLYLKPSALTGWGALTLAEAQSIRVYSDEAKTTELAREVASADEIHVKVPSLTTTTIIYADYDGVRADYAVTDTYGRNAVWGDYLIVWHMNDATTTTVADSTGNWNGTKLSIDNPAETTGKIDKGQNITADYIVTTNSATINTVGVKTIQTWVNFTNLNRSNHFPGIVSGINSGTEDASLQLNNGGTTNRVCFYQFDGAVKRCCATANASTGVWDMYHGAYDGSTLRLYRNGAQNATLASGNSFNHGANARIQLGNSNLNPSHLSDEVRYRKSALSANWITTEYNNQSDVAAFFGTVTDVGGGGGPAAQAARRLFLMGM